MSERVAKRTSRFVVRDWVYVAVFGALWGVSEMTLGAYMHLLIPPLADTFLIGLIMAGLGAVIAMVGRQFVPKVGSVILIGIVTALLKILSLGGMVLGPIVAILAEAILMEIVLSSASKAKLWHFVFAGSLAVSWNFFHKFIMMRIVYGKGVVPVYEKMVVDGSQVLGLDVRFAVWIIVLLFIMRLIVGGVAGWLAWSLGGAVQKRQRQSET